jgi:hypothetical protein
MPLSDEKRSEIRQIVADLTGETFEMQYFQFLSAYRRLVGNELADDFEERMNATIGTLRDLQENFSDERLQTKVERILKPNLQEFYDVPEYIGAAGNYSVSTGIMPELIQKMDRLVSLASEHAASPKPGMGGNSIV